MNALQSAQVFSRFFFALVVVSLSLLNGCKETTTLLPQQQSVKCTFTHVFNGKKLIFNDTNYVKNISGNELQFARLRYLVENLGLVRTDGSVFLLRDYLLVNAAYDTNSITINNLPAGDYTAIRFNIGLDSAVNHGDPNQWGAYHPLNPSVNNLHWNWAGGYIFFQLDGSYKTPTISRSGFSYHVATEAYKTTYTLLLPKPMEQSSSYNIVLDVGSIFNKPFPFDIAEIGPVSHSAVSDTRIMPAFIMNLQSAFTLSVGNE